MSQDPFSLELIGVASPCHVPWEELSGNDQVRFCGQWQLNDYNLAGMSRQDAESLVRQKEGNLCVRLFSRADGTVLTQDCPVGWRTVWRAVVRRVVAFASLLIALLFGSARSMGAGRRWSGSRCIHWLEGKSAQAEKMQVLSLRGTKVTPAGLKALAGLKLHTIYLGEAQVTDTTLRILREINLLHALSQANGKGQRATSLDMVVCLYLDGTQVSDAGLRELTGMTSLTGISLNRRVTDEGVAALQKALPELKKFIR